MDWLAGRTNSKYNFNLESKENKEVVIKLYEALKDFKIEKNKVYLDIKIHFFVDKFKKIFFSVDNFWNISYNYAYKSKN